MTTTVNQTKKTLSKEDKNKAYEKDHRIVRGIFRSFQPIGGSVKFSFKKYPQDKVETYTMQDGQTYEIPFMVAKHLNECKYPEHSNLLDAAGNPVRAVGKYIKRYSFESLEFYEE